MIPLAKNIKRYFSLKEFAIVVLAIAISVSAGFGVFLNLKKEVVIDDNGKQIVLKTMKSTVRDVLEQNGISVRYYDYINVDLDSKLQKIRKNEIYIKRAVPVNVSVDGQELKLMTYRDTVKETLSSNAINLGDEDRLDGLTLDDKIVENMNIKVIRVKEETVAEKFAVPFKTISRENSRLDKGTERVAKEGKEGLREKLYKVVFEDGKEVARNLVNDTVLSNPIDQIVEFGTVLNFKTSRGDVVRYRKVMNMRATAYTSSYADTGKHPGDPGFGVTYTGMRAKKGVIAVDPKVIPLGTRVFVEIPGMNDYGFAVAGDIGGAIKGNLVDLYFDDAGTVDRWGCKNVKIYVLVD